MFMASPQQWLPLFIMAIIIYLVVFSKISTSQPFYSVPQNAKSGKMSWSW